MFFLNRDKKSFYLVYINNKIFVNLFILYNIKNSEKNTLTYFFKTIR